ncbi:MAG: FtsW/RodA/SpoVE family cell cycle protein [Clostridia bacterium]|nr:FtsW/RodA/SpoVE family cell cycle protein [Clostridia bacterium]
MSENVRKMPKAKKSSRTVDFIKRAFHTGGIDAIFCCLVMIIFAFGVTMMYSASYAYANANASSPDVYFKSQLIWGALGFAAMIIISKIDYRILNSFLTPVIFVGMIGLLVLTLAVNAGKPVKRWINLGFGQFQPSEISKFVLILTMAYLICILYKPLHTEKGKRAMPSIGRLTRPEQALLGFFDTKLKCTFALAFVVIIFCGLVALESHLSCTILLFCMGVSMMWLAGVDKKWFALLGIVVVIAVVYVVYIDTGILQKLGGFGYDRVLTWKTKQATEGADRWQQGLLAIGSGGPFGVGFANSKQKQLYIPEPQNDFIFAIICEELGFLGAAVVVLLFAALVCRGFVIATKANDVFGSLLVTGIMMQIGLQVTMNIAVVTDTIPNTGIALPFFSYGGTALVIIFAEMGVVLSVSKNGRLEKQ